MDLNSILSETQVQSIKYYSSDLEKYIANLIEYHHSNEINLLIKAKKNKILHNFYYQAFIFCKKKNLDTTKATIFIHVFQRTIHEDFKVLTSTAITSSQNLRKYLLNFSSTRPPKRASIFDIQELSEVLDFFADNYYRQFHLYQTIMGEPALAPSMTYTLESQEIIEASTS